MFADQVLEEKWNENNCSQKVGAGCVVAVLRKGIQLTTSGIFMSQHHHRHHHHREAGSANTHGDGGLVPRLRGGAWSVHKGRKCDLF